MKAFSISWLSKNVINLWTTTWIIQESQKMGMDTSQKFWESHYFGQLCVCVSLDPSLTHTYSWMNRYQYQNKQINNFWKEFLLIPVHVYFKAFCDITYKRRRRIWLKVSQGLSWDFTWKTICVNEGQGKRMKGVCGGTIRRLVFLAIFYHTLFNDK